MSHVLTETATFDASCVVPDILDTDYPTTVPAGSQALANRTQYLLGQVNSLITITNDLATEDDAQDDALKILQSKAMYSLGPSAPGGIAALSELYDGAAAVGLGDYSLSSNRIHVPFAGKYRLEISLIMLRDTSDIGGWLYLGESIYKQYNTSAAIGDKGTVNVLEFLNITSASAQLISFRPFTGANMVQAGTLELQRLT